MSFLMKHLCFSMNSRHLTYIILYYIIHVCLDVFGTRIDLGPNSTHMRQRLAISMTLKQAVQKTVLAQSAFSFKCQTFSDRTDE